MTAHIHAVRRRTSFGMVLGFRMISSALSPVTHRNQLGVLRMSSSPSVTATDGCVAAALLHKPSNYFRVDISAEHCPEGVAALGVSELWHDAVRTYLVLASRPINSAHMANDSSSAC